MPLRQRSTPSRVLIRLSLTAFLLTGGLLSTGCASAVQKPEILLPNTFREPCVGPATDRVSSVGDLAVFSVRQEAALQACEAKRAGIVDLIDKAQKPVKPWWKVW